MKTKIISAFITMLFAVPAFAVDGTTLPKPAGPNFEKHKSEIISRIDARIARNQEEKSCVQSSQNHADIKACRDKFKADSKQQQQKKP
jgi:hypothetical protein